MDPAQQFSTIASLVIVAATLAAIAVAQIRNRTRK